MKLNHDLNPGGVGYGTWILNLVVWWKVAWN